MVGLKLSMLVNGAHVINIINCGPFIDRLHNAVITVVVIGSGSGLAIAWCQPFASADIFLVGLLVM